MFLVKIETEGFNVLRKNINLENFNIETTQSMVMSICEILDDLECCRFVVKGFGDVSWPVGVYTDLAVFMEQINPAITAVEIGSDFELDFYEQGIERKISFKFENNVYNLNCISLTDGMPESETSIDAQDLSNQLSQFKSDFVSLVVDKIPQLSGTKEFNDWVVEASKNQGAQLEPLVLFIK